MTLKELKLIQEFLLIKDPAKKTKIKKLEKHVRAKLKI